QLAEAGAARPAAAMGVVAASALPQPLLDEPAAQRLRADRQALLGELLAGEGGAEVGAAAAVGCQHLAAEGRVEAVVGRSAPEAMDQGLIPVGLELALEAADVAG